MSSPTWMSCHVQKIQFLCGPPCPLVFHSPILAGFGETVLLSHLLLSIPCLVLFDWLLVSLLATVCSANKFLCALRAELIHGQRDTNSEGSLIIYPFSCYIAKETVNQLKQQPREQEKLSTSYASDQGKTSISQNGFTNKCYQLALQRVRKTLFATLCLPLLVVLMLPLGMTVPGWWQVSECKAGKWILAAIVSC